MAYQGLVVRLPVGLQGFTGSKNPSQMQPGHLTYVDGMTYEGGVIRKDGGAAKLNSSALGSGAVIAAGTAWYADPSTQYDIVFLSTGAVLRDTNGAGTFGSSLVTGLTDIRSPPPMFVPGGGESVGSARKLFMFSATNQVQVVSGTTASMAAISAPAADWAAAFPPFGVLHAGRMWGGGNSNDPHRIYYTTNASHEDYTSAGAGSLPIYPGEGTALVGGVSYRGLLVLFKKPIGVYVVDTRDPTVANWTVSKISGSVGAVNAQTIIPIENDVLYMDHGGNIHLLSATDILGSIQTSNLGQIAEIGDFIRRTVNMGNIYRAAGAWYAGKRQVWLSLCSIGESNNNLRIVIDFNNNQTGPRFLTSYRDVAVSIWIRHDDDSGLSRPAIGDAVGFVYKMDQDARDKDGAAYPFIMETANTDLGFADPQLSTKHKSGQFLELVSEPIGDWNLTVDVYWDDVHTDTIQFNMGSGGAALGSFTLDTSSLGSTVLRSQRQRISGSGRRLKLIAQNGGLNEDVALAEFWLSFKVNDERIRDA